MNECRGQNVIDESQTLFVWFQSFYWRVWSERPLVCWLVTKWIEIQYAKYNMRLNFEKIGIENS